MFIAWRNALCGLDGLTCDSPPLMSRKIMYQVRHFDPAPPGALNPAVHRDLEIITLKCLSK